MQRTVLLAFLAVSEISLSVWKAEIKKLKFYDNLWEFFRCQFFPFRAKSGSAFEEMKIFSLIGFVAAKSVSTEVSKPSGLA